MWNVNDIFAPETELRSCTFSRHNARNSADMSDLLDELYTVIKDVHAHCYCASLVHTLFIRYSRAKIK